MIKTTAFTLSIIHEIHANHVLREEIAFVSAQQIRRMMQSHNKNHSFISLFSLISSIMLPIGNMYRNFDTPAVALFSVHRCTY